MVSEQIISTGLLHDFLSSKPPTGTVPMAMLYAKKLSEWLSEKFAVWDVLDSLNR